MAAQWLLLLWLLLLLLLLLLPLLLLLLLRKHPIGTAAAADVDDVVFGSRGGVEVAWTPR